MSVCILLMLLSKLFLILFMLSVDRLSNLLCLWLRLLHLTAKRVSVVLHSLLIKLLWLYGILLSRSRVNWWLLLLRDLLSLFWQLNLHFVKVFRQFLVLLLKILIQLAESIVFFFALFESLGCILGNFADFPFQLVDFFPFSLSARTNHLKIFLSLLKCLFLLVDFIKLDSLLLFNIFK